MISLSVVLRRPGLAVLLGLILWGAIYVANAWTPSHYGEASQLLAIPKSGPVAGEAAGIRSDEWAVATPYFQIAAAADFGPRDTVSPYRAPLKTFFALPSRDLSMVFKPTLWGFLVLDPAHAYSLHYALLTASMLAGFAILLRRLGCSPSMAAAASALIFLSQFVQLWWTSTAPALALAPWPAVALLWRGPWLLRVSAVAYATAVWLIGMLYPPFIIGAGLAIGTLILSFRPQALGPTGLAAGLAGVAIGGALAVAHYGDLLVTMAATVFPGERRLDGGGVRGLQILASVLPYLASRRFEPLGLWPTNACEVAVVGSFLPLAAACFLDHRDLIGWGRANLRGIAGVATALAVCLAWMLAPLPAAWAPGLDRIPPIRMLWPFGLLLTAAAAIAADAASWRLSPLRVAAFCAVVVGAWAVSKLMLTRQPPAAGGFDLWVLAFLLAALALAWRKPGLISPRTAVLAALVATSAATFGRFNPVQPADRIFRHRPSILMETMEAYARASPRGYVVAQGMWGATLNGVGVPAINHTLLQPQKAVFRRAYPDIPAEAFDTLFNRYAHVTFEPIWAPRLGAADLLVLPPDPFAIAVPVELVGAGALAGPAAATSDVVRLGPRRWGVVVAGTADWRGVHEGQRLRVALTPNSRASVLSASGYRLPRPDVVVAHGDPQLFAAGYGVRLVIETAAELEEPPSDLVLVTPIS